MINLLQGFTDFGIKLKRNDLCEIFNNDASQSKMFLDYHLFDSNTSDYKTDYINQNCLKLQTITLSDLVTVFKNLNFD